MSTAIGDVAKCDALICKTAKCDELEVNGIDCEEVNCIDLNCQTLQVLSDQSTHRIVGNLDINGAMTSNAVISDSLNINSEAVADRIVATHSVIIKINGNPFKMLLASIEDPRK